MGCVLEVRDRPSSGPKLCEACGTVISCSVRVRKVHALVLKHRMPMHSLVRREILSTLLPWVRFQGCLVHYVYAYGLGCFLLKIVQSVDVVLCSVPQKEHLLELP